jgi:hypothetical protein
MDERPIDPEGVGYSPADIRAHDEHDHLAGVFADRQHAAEAVDELRSLGLGSEHLGIAVHGEDAVVFEHDAGPELLHDVQLGALAGAPIGAIAGISLAALTVSGVGAVAVGGVLALAGASAVLGGVLGAYLGAVAGESAWIAHENIGYTKLGEGEVLVVVCSHGHADAVRDVMERHAGRLHTIEAGRI